MTSATRVGRARAAPGASAAAIKWGNDALTTQRPTSAVREPRMKALVKPQPFMCASAYPRRLPPTPAWLRGWAQTATTLGHRWGWRGRGHPRRSPRRRLRPRRGWPPGAKSGPGEVQTAQAQTGGRPACSPRRPASLGPGVVPPAPALPGDLPPSSPGSSPACPPRGPAPETRRPQVRSRSPPAPDTRRPLRPGVAPCRPRTPPPPQARGRPSCLPARTHPAPRRNLTS